MTARFVTPDALVKRHRSGTHRTASPAETLARVAPLLPAMGITRVANVTGLDRIGVPVAMAFRPNARSIAVSPGKGLTLEAAKCSGVMESIEGWHAERPMLPLLQASLEEMSARRRVLDVSALPHNSAREFDPRRAILWAEGHDLLGGEGVWLPYELVHTRFTLPLPPHSGALLPGSNGLASGNHRLEALAHALCELIERDASTLWHAHDDAGCDRSRVDLSTVDDGPCREVLQRFADAGVEACAWEMTSDVGVAAFRCEIVDRAPDPSRPHFPGVGSGCHPAREVALLRALTEAAQTRLTLITGARDDLGVAHFARSFDAAAHARTLDRMRRPGALRRFHEAPTHEADTVHEDVVWLLQRLAGAGIREVPRAQHPRRARGRAGSRGHPLAPWLRAGAPSARTPAGARTMKIIVFAGPTVTAADRAAWPDFEWRAPAAQGDVYRAAHEGPWALGVVDGYFETVPSVWHKEILWAMSRGVRVYGAASMGALRAAALAAFGVVGVGEVFEAFRGGALEDDDEVAVLHGPAEDGYRALSDAMVNVRATLRAAGRAGVITEATRARLEAVAKRTFYQERSLAGLVRECAGLDGVDALRAWLPGGRVDQKRLDALALFARLRDDAARGLGPVEVDYAFEHTDAWEAMCRALQRAA